jgi:LmbE family N-acetylglucosaminyl deacetylase
MTSKSSTTFLTSSEALRCYQYPPTARPIPPILATAQRWAMMLPMDVERILVVAAHPDDIDFGVAGTVASWTDAGVAVSYCCVTNGDNGGFDPAVARSEIPAIRRAEQTAAAQRVGVRDLHFLGYPDGRVTVTMELRRDLARLIRQLRPQRVVCPSPERNWDSVFASHPDHLASGAAALAAVYPDARNPFAHPELAAAGLETHIVEEVWMIGGPSPNHYEDVTERFDRKIAALLCHASQLSSAAEIEERVRASMRRHATRGGLADGRLAEAFQVFHTGE